MFDWKKATRSAFRREQKWTRAWCCSKHPWPASLRLDPTPLIRSAWTRSTSVPLSNRHRISTGVSKASRDLIRSTSRTKGNCPICTHRLSATRGGGNTAAIVLRSWDSPMLPLPSRRKHCGPPNRWTTTRLKPGPNRNCITTAK